MGLSDIFVSVVLIVLSVGFCWFIVDIIISIKRKKNYENGIKLVKDCKSEIIWIVISASNLILQAMNYSDKKEIVYLFMICTWSICLLVHVLSAVFNSCYITSEGFFVTGSRKIFSKDEYKYKTNENVLELINKKNGAKFKFRIVENREDLMLLLDKNYVPYIG